MKDLFTFFQGNPLFSNLVTELRKREGLFSIVESHLPEHLRTGCQLGSFDGRVLTLSYPSATFATHFHYAKKTLKSALAEYREFKGLEEIKCYVRPVTDRFREPPRPTEKRPLAFSESVCEQFAFLAEDTDDPELKAVLERFAAQKRQEPK